MYRASLQARIILSIVLVVTVTSFAFSFALLQIKDQLEEVTFGSMVRDQMQILSSQENEGLLVSEDLFAGWEFYTGESVASLPEEIRSLNPGSHHSIFVDDRYYQIEVSARADELMYLTYDITEWEAQEHAVLELLAYGMIAVLLLAIIVGLIASKASLLPLRALTRRLASIQPNERSVRIGDEFQGNEVGTIAAEFDRYLTRLDDFVEREKFFTAAASHELRTPLSVVMGAVDVLDAQYKEAPPRALSRIKRACAEMLSFIETTLFLSREEANFANTTGECDLTEIVEELLEDNSRRMQERSIVPHFEAKSSALFSFPPSIVKMVVSNVLQNAIEHTKNGTIEITQEKGRLRITDSGEGIDSADLPNVFNRNFTTKSSGAGMGLSLVKKLCERIGWNVSIESVLGEGTSVEIVFN